MSAGYHDETGRRLVKLPPPIFLAMPSARRRRGVRRRRRLSWLLAWLLVLALLPRESGVLTGAGVATVPTPVLVAAAEPPPPPVEPVPPATVEPPAPATVEPPPVVVEMPPPIPGPLLALAVPPPPERKPTPPARVAHGRPVPLAPVATPTASPASTEAPVVARAEAPVIDAHLSAEEAALIEEYRGRVAASITPPGWRRDPQNDAALSALAGELHVAEARRALSASRGTILLASAEEDWVSRVYASPSYTGPMTSAASVRALSSPKTHPVAFADLTPEERMMILARRGLKSPHHVRVASWVKVLETANPDWRERTVWPAIPIDAPPPVLPSAAMQPKAQWTAVALVHVARDGTATQVRITKPVADEAVNRALEDALDVWRFRATFISSGSSYMYTYNPNDSVIELTVRISVS